MTNTVEFCDNTGEFFKLLRGNLNKSKPDYFIKRK